MAYKGTLANMKKILLIVFAFMTFALSLNADDNTAYCTVDGAGGATIYATVIAVRGDYVTVKLSSDCNYNVNVKVKVEWTSTNGRVHLSGQTAETVPPRGTTVDIYVSGAEGGCARPNLWKVKVSNPNICK